MDLFLRRLPPPIWWFLLEQRRLGLVATVMTTTIGVPVPGDPGTASGQRCDAILLSITHYSCSFQRT